MAVYYNENDPFAAAWLRELIRRNLIAQGDVDERSIMEVRTDDLKGYTQHHFFAGIGGWSYALRLAGWPDTKPVWTGSCPCQPFSAAGKRKGFADERHLWPVWFPLIRECRPEVIFGEQVASKDALRWLDGQNEGLRKMWDSEAVLGVLRQFQRTQTITMQGMRESCRKNSQAFSPRNELEKLFELAEKEARFCIDGDSKVSSKAKESAIFSRSRKHSRTNQQGVLRTDRDSVRLDATPKLECPFAGQNKFTTGIYARECKSGPLCSQCDGEHMGTQQDLRDCIGDFEPQEGQKRGVILRNSLEIETANRRAWGRSVRLDLEGEGYACGAIDTCAASVGAPHIRQRLYFAATLEYAALEQVGIPGRARKQGSAVALSNGGNSSAEREQRSGEQRLVTQNDGSCGLGISSSQRLPQRVGNRGVQQKTLVSQTRQTVECRGNPWSLCDWLPYIDGKQRPVERGTFPLVARLPGSMVPGGDPGESYAQASSEARVGRLRGYGNAIVPQLAAEFITAYLDVIRTQKRPGSG